MLRLFSNIVIRIVCNVAISALILVELGGCEMVTSDQVGEYVYKGESFVLTLPKGLDSKARTDAGDFLLYFLTFDDGSKLKIYEGGAADFSSFKPWVPTETQISGFKVYELYVDANLNASLSKGTVEYGVIIVDDYGQIVKSSSWPSELHFICDACTWATKEYFYKNLKLLHDAYEETE